jgi:hypothetical protein
MTTRAEIPAICILSSILKSLSYQIKKVLESEGKSAHMAINATGAIGTNGTQFGLFTTKNMGATGALKFVGNLKRYVPKVLAAIGRTGARLNISGAYRVPENIVG